MPNWCTCTQKRYPECPSSAAALVWRQVRAALPPCHGHALASEIPHYIPEGPHPAPDTRLNQPNSMGSMGRGREGSRLHLNVGAYVTRGISLGSAHSRDGANGCIYPPAPARPSPSCAHWLLPKLSPCTTAGLQAPAWPGAAGGTRGRCLMLLFTWPLRTMVRCRQVQYTLPALLAYFVPMYELDTFSNFLGETLYWIHE